jgi:polygalacturonase
VKGVKVTNHFNSSVAKIQNDGIDLLSNAHSRVSRCFVLTQDDAMCLKGAFFSASSPKFGYATDMTNVTFSQNTVYTSCAGAKYGMQARAPMSNSVFVDHYIVHCRRAVVVEATEGNSPMSNLRFERVYVDEVGPTLSYDPHPIQIDTKCNAIRNVTVKDVTFQQAAGYKFSGSSPLEGKSSTYNVEGIQFVDIRYAGQPPILTAKDGDFEVGKYVTDVTFKAT